jgi:hypothetical protein
MLVVSNPLISLYNADDDLSLCYSNQIILDLIFDTFTVRTPILASFRVRAPSEYACD